jgi:hypothetical protein
MGDSILLINIYIFILLILHRFNYILLFFLSVKLMKKRPFLYFIYIYEF